MKKFVPLNEEVSHDFPWLFSELGFEVIGFDFRPESFGDSFVTLKSDVLRLRFVRDRGQVRADVGPPSAPRKWWPLTLVIEAIHGTLPEVKPDLPSAAALLQENFADVVVAMGPKFRKTEAELQRLAAPKPE